jgi:RHS repeat-associated protein
VYLGDLPVAALTQAAIGQTTVSYIYADHLNTARVIVRPSDQAILWTWASTEPFGQTLATNPNSATLGAYTYNPRFPGQVFDAEAGWFYNINRDYNPALGRYAQPDPLGLSGGSLSAYGYVGGNPLAWADSRGLFPTDAAFDRYAIVAPHGDGALAFGVGTLLTVSTLGAAELMGIGPLAAFLFETNNVANGLPASRGSRGVSGNCTASDIPEILDQTTVPFGTTGTTASVNTSAELDSLFAKLTKGGNAPIAKPYGTDVTLSDGTTVTMRNSSNSGGATIDINYKGSLGVPGNFKIHINHP